LPNPALAARRFGPLVALGIATLGLYREILLPTWILADYDIWAYFYPLRSYAAQALQQGRFPLWNPDIFLGSPFFANPQTSMLYPGTVFFYVLPIGYAYSLSVILHVALAAFFMYAFLRRGWELPRIAAFVGAAAFGFGGFLSSQVGHINQLSASAWLPAIALCADTAVRRRNLCWAIVGAVALAAQLLAGHAQESYMTVWVVGIVMLWRGTFGPDAQAAEPTETVTNQASETLPTSAAETDSARSFHVEHSDYSLVRGVVTTIWVGAVVLGVGFGLAAVQLVPTTELSGLSIRGGGMSAAEAISFSLPPTSLVRSLMPGYWYNLGSEEIGYIGGIGLGFAAIALLFGRWRLTLCAGVLAFLGLFLAVGGANPFYVPLLGYVPGLGLFRVPSRWLFVYTFGVASLAAIGIDWAFSARASVQASVGQSFRAAGRARLVRLILVGLFLAALVAAAIPFASAVSGTIALLWLLALFAAFAIAVLALRWPTSSVAGLLGSLVLVELVAASIDLPQRYPAPAMVLDSRRPVPTYLQQNHPNDRILSIAPTEYPLEDEPELATRYPGLHPRATFFLTSALKLDEVMSPNVPLRYGLSTIDGYDGGVLPLRRYLQVASLLVPPNEIRVDGVLRTRLIAVPDPRLLRLFNIQAVIANQAFDVELEGTRFDVATARRLTDGATARVELPGGMPVQSLSLLSSVEGMPGQVGEGRMRITRADGSREEIPLRIGDRLFLSTDPGPLRAPQPTAGLSRGGRMDSAVRFPIAEGSPVAAIDWTWSGPGTWELRGVVLTRPNGAQEQLMLYPGLKRTLFPVLKVYEPIATTSDARLIPRAEVLSDEDALSRLKGMTAGEIDEVVFLAPNQTPAMPSAAVTSQLPPGSFRRASRPTERMEYTRVEGSGGGYLLVDDAWFPGWRAEVDGAAATVYRANVGFKTVYVPPNARSVVLTYEPSTIRFGAVASICFVVLAALLFFSRRVLLLTPWRRSRG